MFFTIPNAFAITGQSQIRIQQQISDGRIVPARPGNRHGKAHLLSYMNLLGLEVGGVLRDAGIRGKAVYDMTRETSAMSRKEMRRRFKEGHVAVWLPHLQIQINLKTIADRLDKAIASYQREQAKEQERTIAEKQELAEATAK